MKFTIKAARVDDPGSLCGSCSYATLITDVRGTRTRYCNKLDRDMPHSVERCTAYQERGALSLYDMKEIGWILETNPRRKAGFMPPKDHGQKPPAHLDAAGELEYDDDD